MAEWVRTRRFLAGSVEINRVDIRIRDLPEELDGFALAHLSDLHVGQGLWVPLFAQEAARIVQASAVDLVVNTGDFLQGQSPVDKATVVARQFSLSHPASAPAHLAILGNHDYYSGEASVDALKYYLAASDICVLVNEITCVNRRGASITFAGLTRDEEGFDAAVDRLHKSERPLVALVHEPDVAEQLPGGCADLILAGHTHGGQITLPGLEGPIVRLFCGSHYVHGLYSINDIPMYVNRGLGTTGVPLRFRARPEIAIIRLLR